MQVLHVCLELQPLPSSTASYQAALLQLVSALARNASPRCFSKGEAQKLKKLHICLLKKPCSQAAGVVRKAARLTALATGSSRELVLNVLGAGRAKQSNAMGLAWPTTSLQQSCSMPFIARHATPLRQSPSANMGCAPLHDQACHTPPGGRPPSARHNA